MKHILIAVAMMFAALALPVQAYSTEGFSPVADHSVPVVYVGQQAVAIAECDRCMYAGLGDKQPLITMNRPNNDGVTGSGASNDWTGPYEVGWRS